MTTVMYLPHKNLEQQSPTFWMAQFKDVTATSKEKKTQVL
jgi:hypothetical protein